MVGCQLASKRQPAVARAKQSRQAMAGAKQSRLGRPPKKGRMDFLERAVTALNTSFSDDEGIASALGSEDDANNAVELDDLSSSSDASLNEDITEWLTFADAEEVSRNGIFMDDDDDENFSDVEESNEPQKLGGFKRCSATVIGLHWDTSAEIPSHPDIKKPAIGSTVKQQFHYLFKSPIRFLH